MAAPIKATHWKKFLFHFAGEHLDFKLPVSVIYNYIHIYRILLNPNVVCYSMFVVLLYGGIGIIESMIEWGGGGVGEGGRQGFP